jgi:hypothetical protein
MNSKQAIDKIMKILNLTPQKFFEAKTDQGVQLKMEGELEVGGPIYVATEEGIMPAPDGTHKIDDGSEIEVIDGKVSKIKMGNEETKKTDDAKIEDEKEKVEIADEDMSNVELEFGDVKLKSGEVLRIGTAEPGVGVAVKKVGYDGTLSAIADGEYETEGGKMISITGGAIDGYQDASDKENKSPKTEEIKTGEMSAVEIAQIFAQALKKFEVKLDAIEEKFTGLETKFTKFSKEPAGEKVYNQKTVNFDEENRPSTKLESFKKMRELLSNK